MAILEVNNVKNKKDIHDTIWRQPGTGAKQHQLFRGKRRVRGNHGRIRFRKNNPVKHSGSTG